MAQYPAPTNAAEYRDTVNNLIHDIREAEGLVAWSNDPTNALKILKEHRSELRSMPCPCSRGGNPYTCECNDWPLGGRRTTSEGK